MDCVASEKLLVLPLSCSDHSLPTSWSRIGAQLTGTLLPNSRCVAGAQVTTGVQQICKVYKCDKCMCLKCDICIGITCKEDGCMGSKVVETFLKASARSSLLLEISWKGPGWSSHVKPCQAIQPRREIFVLCTCYCSKRLRVGSTGDRRVRGHQERSPVNHGNSWELMGTHGKSWELMGKREAGPILILWILRHSVLEDLSDFMQLPHTVLPCPTFEATLPLRLICKNGRFD